MLLLFQSVVTAGTWGRNNLDNMKVMLVTKGRRLDSMGRAIADAFVFQVSLPLFQGLHIMICKF